MSESLRQGYGSVDWDFSYLTGRIDVVPGEYKVAIDKDDNGVFTRLAEPKSFNVITLPNALGKPDFDERFAFAVKVNKLGEEVSLSMDKIREINEKLESMKNGLSRLPVEGGFLVQDINSLKSEVDTISNIMTGGFGAKLTVRGSLGFAGYASSGAHVDVTGAQREQFNIAKEMYEGQAGKIDDLYDNKLPALLKKYKDAGGVI
jgi:hypothetical protein